MRKYWPIVVIAVMVFARAQASDHPDPRDLLDTTIETLRTHVTRDHERLEREPHYAMSLVQEIVSPHVDLRLASRLVLGAHWKTATDAQRDAFVESLRGLLLRIFALHIADYREAEVSYSPTVFKGDRRERAVVRTEVSRSGVPPVAVDYRLYRSPDGWKVYDVTILGISLVKTYHITIEYDLRKFGLDGVIERMNAKSPLTNAGGLPVDAPPTS
jgi:phospholipid transport system substrate-binding protein